MSRASYIGHAADVRPVECVSSLYGLVGDAGKELSGLAAEAVSGLWPAPARAARHDPPPQHLATSTQASKGYIGSGQFACVQLQVRLACDHACCDQMGRACGLVVAPDRGQVAGLQPLAVRIARGGGLQEPDLAHAGVRQQPGLQACRTENPVDDDALGASRAEVRDHRAGIQRLHALPSRIRSRRRVAHAELITIGECGAHSRTGQLRIQPP
jgi:hypothetical protein